MAPKGHSPAPRKRKPLLTGEIFGFFDLLLVVFCNYGVETQVYDTTGF